jgi:molybdenum cofactor cytidylyltransferase
MANLKYINGPDHKVSGLIIAAGMSRRMGAFKPLMNFNSKPFIENIIEKIKDICSTIVIVSGYNHDELNSFIDEKYSAGELNIHVLKNKKHQMGMFSSIKAGIQKLSDSEWILYHLVDQPNIPKQFYFDFVDLKNVEFDWIQPQCKEKSGHPILIGKKIIGKILKSDLNSNLREITNSADVKKIYWDCRFREILTDLDTSVDLEKLKKGGS